MRVHWWRSDFCVRFISIGRRVMINGGWIWQFRIRQFAFIVWKEGAA